MITIETMEEGREKKRKKKKEKKGRNAKEKKNDWDRISDLFFFSLTVASVKILDQVFDFQKLLWSERVFIIIIIHIIIIPTNYYSKQADLPLY
jgi:hypothetical protein